MKRILLIVDPQNDFITGSLAVEGAKEKMMNLADYIKEPRCLYDYICVTMDSHPIDHMSFKENGGIWPKHCVAYTEGWNIPEYLYKPLLIKTGDKYTHVSYHHKGTDPAVEEYSIFNNKQDGLALEGYINTLIRQNGTLIDVCGIAGDYCVLETIKGLRQIIGDRYINVLMDYTASIDGGEKLLKYLDENNINYTT